MSALDDFKEEFRSLLQLRIKKDETKAAADKAKDEYNEAEAELYEALDQAGIRGRLEFDFGGDLGVAKFQRASTTFGQIIDTATAVASLESEGLDDVIYEKSVRKGRLNELVRDRDESGADLPDGVALYRNKRISVSRA